MNTPLSMVDGHALIVLVIVVVLEMSGLKA